MTLRLKINLIVGMLTLAILVAVMGLQLATMRDSVKEEVVAANRVASQLLQRMSFLYAAQGVPAMLDFLRGVGRVRSNEISLYDGSGTLLYQSPKSPYKSGRSAPAWFEALISPQQSEQSIEFPDGKLVVRANASRAALDTWDTFSALVMGAVLLLALLLAVLHRVVGVTLQPLSRIADAMQQVRAGRFDVTLPPLPGSEAAAIGTSFNEMVAQLREHIATERRAALAESRLSDSRALSRWMDRHIEQERRMIARELHDELGQSVTAIRSMALSVASRTAAVDPQAEQAARLIAEESSRLYDAMHGLIPRLTPLVLDNFGLGEALADLTGRMQLSHPELQVATRLDLPDTPLSAEVTLALYRAAQEGITNALRHGAASRIDLELHRDGERIMLTLTDNGHGLPDGSSATSPEGHYGLRWLVERVEGLGGTVALQPSPTPPGARLRVDLPIGAGA